MNTQQRPRLTDDAVRRLPLEAGKAALLDELLAEAPAARRTPRWVAPLAAAAVVAGVIGASTLWPGASSEDPPDDVGPASQGPSVATTEPARATEVALTAPGWRVTHLGEDGVSYAKGGAEVEITTYPADLYDGYVEDREHISDPPAPGDPVQVLGRSGQVWAYSADDHTTIVAPADGEFVELRASGLRLPAYLSLLSGLQTLTPEAFDDTLPATFVTHAERPAEAAALVAEIEAVSGAGFPGATPSFAGPASDAYQFGISVTGAYACAWLALVGTDRTAEAQQVLATVPQWPVLDRLGRTGMWGSGLRQLAQEAQSGSVRQDYPEWLGCGAG